MWKFGNGNLSNICTPGIAMGEEGLIRNLRIGVNLAHAKGNEKALGPLEVGGQEKGKDGEKATKWEGKETTKRTKSYVHDNN